MATNAPRSLDLPPLGADPAALPVVRPGTTIRYCIDEHLVPHLRAVLNHPAVTVVRRPHYAKGLPS